MDELPPWFELVAVQQPWALLMILPSLIVGITATLSVFKLKGFSKSGLKVAATNNNDKKSAGDDRLQTDDLLLNGVGSEGSKKISSDESKLLSPEGSHISFSKSDGKKKPDIKDSTMVDKGFSSNEGNKLGVTNTVPKINKSKSDSKISSPLDSTTLSSNLKESDSKPEMSSHLSPPENFAGEAKKDNSSSEDIRQSDYKAVGYNKFKPENSSPLLPPESLDREVNKNVTPVIGSVSGKAKILEEPKPALLNEATNTLKILNTQKLTSASKQSVKSLEDLDLEKKKPDLEDLNLSTNTVASYPKSLEDSSDNAPILIREVSSYPAGEKSPTAKKPITDFSPNFVNVTSDRKLNIGRSDQDGKRTESPSYFMEKSDSEEGSSLPPFQEKPKKAEASRYDTAGNLMSNASVCAVPDLIATKRSNTSNPHYDFNTIESIISASKDSEKYGDKFQLSKLNQSKLLARPFPVDAIDPLTIPGYKPSISEKPILPKDFIKFTEPGAITSYDLVPGPPLLKTMGALWKYVPLLGTQFVATLIYSLQSLISSCDRRLKYPYIYPYYYLLNKYGPMVRLHGPIGADILIMAVNGLDFPVVHIKMRANKKQSLFDSLNTYRSDAAPLSYMLNFGQYSRRIPDNPTLQIDQHYKSLERITDDFLRRKKFTRSYTGAKEDESHGNDLVKWAMQCTMDVYFKSKRDFLDPTESSKILDNFVKVCKSVRLCETGIQLWRAFPTLTWFDLTENCKEIDRFIVNEVSHCMMNTNQGKTSGSVVELLLATDELRTTDLLTPLLDLLIINVNMAANLAGFLLYNLSKTPQVQRTLFREVSSVVPKGKTNIELTDLAKLKYLNACITETLRMAPLFPILSRQIEEDTKIHSFQIPKGTYIQMVNVLPCARGDVSYDDVGRFQAERWTEKNTSLGGDPLMGLPQWQSFPKFNKDLVVTQVALLVAKVVREYRLEYPTAEVYADGMVLQGPTTPFNFAFIERVL